MTGERGPKSKDGAIRRNAPKATTALVADVPIVPELAGDYQPQTMAWWNAWVNGPQAAFFAATDWQTLLRLAPLVDAFYVAPTTALAAEIRMTEAKLGGTAADRDRLGWKIEPPAEPAPEGVKGSRSRPDPRTKKEAAKS